MESGEFDENDLVRCYALPNLLSVMAGNKVMLRSGGPEMIVAGTDINGYAICHWIENGVLQKHTFQLACLTCYGAR